jgi:hypothetical protein
MLDGEQRRVDLFLLPISSRQIDESVSIADFFPLKNCLVHNESISIADF